MHIAKQLNKEEKKSKCKKYKFIRVLWNSRSNLLWFKKNKSIFSEYVKKRLNIKNHYTCKYITVIIYYHEGIYNAFSLWNWLFTMDGVNMYNALVGCWEVWNIKIVEIYKCIYIIQGEDKTWIKLESNSYHFCDVSKFVRK